MGIGGIETGVRDIAKYLNKKKIDNYILCESSNKNLKIKGLKIIKLDNSKFKNITVSPCKFVRMYPDIGCKKNIE